ncbi:YdcH family protein [Sediminibacterium sp.]|uniref:YdcH family protein n=1 Tax=Sediminibacterium sp. TaxID=1917865 RepID=UPI003F69CD18
MEKHDLHHEFPGMDARITALKVDNAHFKKLADEYDEVNHSVYRIESGAENSSDETLTQLRKQRLQLKDELYAMLTQ